MEWTPDYGNLIRTKLSKHQYASLDYPRLGSVEDYLWDMSVVMLDFDLSQTSNTSHVSIPSRWFDLEGLHSATKTSEDLSWAPIFRVDPRVLIPFLYATMVVNSPASIFSVCSEAFGRTRQVTHRR